MEKETLQVEEIRKLEDRVDKHKFLGRLKAIGAGISYAAGVVAGTIGTAIAVATANDPFQGSAGFGLGPLGQTTDPYGVALIFGGVALTCGIVGTVAARFAHKDKVKAKRIQEDISNIKGSNVGGKQL